MADNSAFYLPSYTVLGVPPSLVSPGNLYVLRTSKRDVGYFGESGFLPGGKEPRLGDFGYSTSTNPAILSTASGTDSMQIKFTSFFEFDTINHKEGTYISIPYRVSADPVTYSMLAFNSNGVLDLANVTGQSSLGDDIALKNSTVTVSLDQGMLTDPMVGSVGIVSDISLVYSTKNLSIQGSMLANFTAEASNQAFTSYVYSSELSSLVSGIPSDWYHSRKDRGHSTVALENYWVDKWIFDKGSGNNILMATVRADDISLEQNMQGDLNAIVSNLVFDSRRVFEVNNNVIQTAGFLANSATLSTDADSSLKGTGLLDLGTQAGARWTGDLDASISNITLGKTKFVRFDSGSVTILDDVFTNSKEDKDHQAPDRATFKLKVGDAEVSFIDPDFPVTGLRSEMQDNTFESIGLNAGSVSLSNMTGSINTSVTDVTISAEKANPTATTGNWKKLNEDEVTGDAAKARNVFALEDNRATAAAVKADDVTLDESFDGTLTAHVAKLDTNYTEYTYTYKVLNIETTAFTPTHEVTKFAASATGYRDLLGKDFDDKEKGISQYKVKVSDDPEKYAYIDSYSGTFTKAPQGTVETWDATGNYIDPDSGFIYDRATYDATKKKVYIDPVTGYYVKVVKTEVTSGDTTTYEYKGYLYDDVSLSTASRIYWQVADDPSDPFRVTFFSEDEKFIIARTLTAGDTIGVVNVEDRPADTKKADYATLSGIEASAYGIYAEKSIKSSGNMRGDIFVSGDVDKLERTGTYDVDVVRSNYTAAETAAKRNLYRVGSSIMYGLYAPSITVDGILDSTIYVVDNTKSWTEDQSTDPVTLKTKSYTRTTAEGIHADTLSATALGGTIYMFSNFYGADDPDYLLTAMSTPYNNASIAVSVKNFENGNDGSFDIIGDIYSSHNGIFAGVETTGPNYKGFDLRVSGTIVAGRYIDAYGEGAEKSTLPSLINPYYAVVDAYGTYTSEASSESSGSDSGGMTFLRANDYLELAAGSHVEGAVYFGNGNDTLVLDSNARLEGDVGMMLGTLNMVFNLNDYAMQNVPADGAATIEGSIPTFSTMLMTVTLNDVQMGPETAAKTYKLVHDTYDPTCRYLQSLRVVNVKYDGISLETLSVEGSDIIAQIGYYDSEGVWHTVKGVDVDPVTGEDTEHGANISELGFEFREKNFSAKIGAMKAIDFDEDTEGVQPANYIRIIDRNLAGDDKVIFQAHTIGDNTTPKTSTSGTLSIVVDRLPTQVVIQDGDGNDTTPYCADPFPVKLSNLRERYDRENNTFTVLWDDNSADTTQTTYQLEYYIETYADATFTGAPVFTSRTIVQNVTNKNPRTDVVLSNIEPNQKVVWRVRQAVGQGNDVVGDWAEVNTFERPLGLLETKDQTTKNWTLAWRNEADVANGEYYMLSVTVYDKATGGSRQLYSDYTTPDEKGWAVVNPGTEGKVEWGISAAELGENESISSWSVRRALGADPAAPVEQSEAAIYQNLQIAKYQYSAVTGLDAKVGTGKAMVLSWDNVSEKDVSFVLHYKITGSIEKEGTVVIDPNDPAEFSTITDSMVSYSIPMDAYMLSDDHLQWEVYACQINGDETAKSVTSTADTTVVQVSGQYVASTASVIPTDSRLGYVSFTWDNAGDETTTYLLEYTAGGKEYQKFIDSSEAQYFVDEATGQNRITWEVKPSSGTGDVSWRVRHYQLNDKGDLVEAGEWMIYEREDVTMLSQGSEIVTDEFTGKQSKTVTLSFVSNNPGSAYRLEYVILTGGVAGNPEAVDFEASSKKNFSWQVEGLEPDDSQTVQWRVTTVENGVPGDWVYETTVMEKTFETVVFLDDPTNATSAEGDGQNSVATLTWDHGNVVKNGLYTYVVEYFQNAKYMSAEDITEFFENNTDDDGAILNKAFTRLEVSNNEVTITGLQDTQYVYWRVKAVDYENKASDWTVGDPFHVYLGDTEAPQFSKNPTQTQTWSSQDTENPGRRGDMMDVYLSWNAATDDKAGVKNYTFTYERTSGSAEQTPEIKYYYSIKNDETNKPIWVEMDYDEEKGARIDHIEGVSDYKVMIANLVNGDYSWNLTATDYQSHTSAEAKTGSWSGDFLNPEFVGDSEETPSMTVTMAAFLSDPVGAGSAKDLLATLAPVLSWTMPEDDWKEEGDNAGSGVEKYRLEWQDSAGNKYSVTIPAYDTEQGEWITSWQLTPDVPFDTNDDKLLKDSYYTWSFYAIDYMGNESVISKDFSSLTGTWTADDFAPVFESQQEPTVTITPETNLIKVNMSWFVDQAHDYWDEAGGTEGSGIRSFTVAYKNINASWDDASVKTVYVDEATLDPDTGRYQLSINAIVQNDYYDYVVYATDYMGNAPEIGYDDESFFLSGTWTKSPNEPDEPTNVQSGVSFIHAHTPYDPGEDPENPNPKPADWNRMHGDLSWGESNTSAYPAIYYKVSYTLLMDTNTGEEGSDTPVDSAYVLSGFAGTVTPEFESVADFVQLADNKWSVTFKDDATHKEHILVYDGSGYTTTFELNGGTESGEISFQAGTFTSDFELVNKSHYKWDLTAVSFVGGTKTITGDPAWNWEGDSAAPNFTETQSITQEYRYDRIIDPSSGSKITVNAGTVTIVNPATDWRLPGDFDPEKNLGTGVGSYTIRWGTGDVLDYSKTIYVDNFGESENPYFVLDRLQPGLDYRFEVYATDYYGSSYKLDSDVWTLHTSAIPQNGVWRKDAMAPRITDDIDTLSVAGFSGNKMENTLTWTAATDDRSIAGDGLGCGTGSYTFTYAFGTEANNSKTYTIVGDDFDFFKGEAFPEYTMNVSESGVVTYSRSKKEDNGNKWDLVYTCKTTTSGEAAENGGTYKLTFTLKNEDYTWSLYADDYVGNSGATTQTRSGSWAKDTAAPVFTSAVGASAGNGTVPGCMFVEATWNYKSDVPVDPEEDKGRVIDPTVATELEDNGSGVQSFYFKYREAGTASWSSIKVDAGKGAKDSKITVTCKDGVYTARGANLDASKDWEWIVDAVDFMGNTITGQEEMRSGVWTGDKLAPRRADGTSFDEGIFTEAPHASYSELTSGGCGLTLSATWTAAVDDWLTVGDGNGVGVDGYTFAYRPVGSSEDYTLTVLAQPTEAGAPVVFLQEDVQPNTDYEWYLVATDYAGNATEQLTGTILVDLKAPVYATGTVSLDSDYDEATKTAELTFDWTEASDLADTTRPDSPISGMWKYDLVYKPVDSGEWTILHTTTDVSDTEFTVTVKTPSDTSATASDLKLADGWYNWDILAYDKAGNTVSATGGTTTFFFDTVAPVFQKFSDDSYFHVTDSYSDTGLNLVVDWREASDNVSGVKSYTFSYRNMTTGGDWTVVEIAAGTGETVSQALNADGNGDYEWKLKAVDNMGNETAELTGSWESADLNAPQFESGTFNMQNVYDVEAKTNALTFNWTKAVEPEPAGRVVSGFADYVIAYAAVGSDVWTTLATETDQNTTTLTVNVPADQQIADGIYRWRISAQDHAGNTSDKNGTSQLVIDVTAPVFESSENSITYTYDPETGKYSSFTFAWNEATDATSGFDRYELSYGYDDGTGTIITEKTITITDPAQIQYTLDNQTFKHDATYSWWVDAVDCVGNRTELKGSETFTVDTQPPAGKFTKLNEGPTIIADWKERVQWENPYYVTYYDFVSADVIFSLDNTFTEEGVSYQLRVFGKGASGEAVRMHTFSTTETAFVLSDKAGQGIGYVANMDKNTVYWQVRALDANGNATEWYDGTTFKFEAEDPQENKRTITDNQKPAAVSGINASDSVDTGVLTLSWDEAEDGFGIDSYTVEIFDSGVSAGVYSASAANGNLSLKLTQSQLANGKYTCKVKAVDCSGNVGVVSAPYAFTYDTMAPAFDPDSLECTVTSSRVDFSWDAMIDNIEAGHYAVRISRADNGSLIVNENVTGTSYSWTSMPSAGEYKYSIEAVDAHGNVSGVKAEGSVSIVGVSQLDWNWNDDFSIRTLGTGTEKDVWTVKLDGQSPLDSRSAAALVDIRIECGSIDPLNTSSITASIYDENGGKIDSVMLLPTDGGDFYEGQFLMNEEKQLSSSFQIQIETNDPGQELQYGLAIRKTDFVLSNTLDDTYSQVRDSAGYRIELPAGDISGQRIVGDEWLGFSDEVDFRQITVDADGTYTFDITDLSAPVEATLWKTQPSGDLCALEWGFADDGVPSLQLDTCTLLQGETYYLSIEGSEASIGRETRYNVLVSGGSLAS